ncbi:hypothetical protein GUA87_10515 [Sneathiella sp. P13V-1]|uniref:hypothetical protein n=1 Tax=Sneathiella sp. P13V-1 TaxID=2697366 RepID=UPI00187B1732|nr:hypothetical protein [Sneathiella sp. P13V-1]MBE7637278.1 hypothetical protein [Sneathiella sp. P13V-1]
MKKIFAGMLAGLTLVALTSSVSASVLAYSSDSCKGTIKDIYNNIEIKNLTLKSSSFLPIYGGFGDSGTIMGFETWYSFNECKGNLVVHVDRACGFANVYTTGSCKIEGVPSY